ncbi:MAG: PAS domain S-box protein [Flavobacterium sp.]
MDNKTTIDYTSLFKHNPIPNWVYDLETFKILDVNEAAVEHYGYSREEFLQFTIKDLRPQQELLKLFKIHQEIEKNTGRISFGVIKHLKKNGEIILVEKHGHKIDFQERKAILVSLVDVTQKLKALENIKASEEKLKEAAKIAKLGYWKLDLIDNTLNWSDEVYGIWGLNSETFTPTFENFLNALPPEDKKIFEKIYEEVLAGTTEINHAHKIKFADGSEKWIKNRGRIEIINGKAVSVFGTVQDITEEKKEEQRLRLLESVITNTNDAVLITEAEPHDKPGPRILYVNEAFTKMTGYTAEEMIGKTPRILQGPKSDRAELKRLKNALKNFQSCEIETINYKKSGEPFWIHFTVTPVADDKGWYTHMIAIERNVTVQKNQQIQNELLNEISNAFNLDTTLKNSLQNVCDTVSRFTDACFTEIWLPNPQNNSLHLFVNSIKNETGNIFCQEASSFNIFKNDEGIPGNVWMNKTNIIIDDADKNPIFIRNKAAKKAGIKTIMGMPLMHNKNCLGVLLFGSPEGKSDFVNSRPVLNKLETFIGSEINRKKLETELQLFFDALPDMICLVDLNGNIIKINLAGCEMLGYSSEEIVGTAYQEYVHPADKDLTLHEQNQLMLGKASTKFENRYISRTGEIIWLSWNSSVNKEEGIIYATAKNITQEKKLKEQIYNANQLAKIGNWRIDTINDKLYWSEMIHELHETDPNTYIPVLETAIDFYKEEYRENIKKILENTIATGQPFDFEAPIISAKGNQKWVRAIGKAEFIHDTCIGLFGSFQDISQIKTTEIQLSEILGSISDAFYAVDKNWNFTYFNTEAERLLSRKSEDLIGKNIWKEFFPAVGTELEKAYKEVAKSGKSQSFEYLYPGDDCWYEINTYPSNNGISSYFKNIDEKRKNAVALHQAYEEKNKILESIGDAFFAVDNQWTVTYWNRMAEEMLSRPKHEIIGKNLWTVYSDAIDTDFYTKYHLAKETGEMVMFEAFYPTLEMWIEVTAYPSKEGLSVYFKNITSRKEIERKIIEANERFEKVALATSDAIWDWDINANRFYKGDGFDKLFSYKVNNHITEYEKWSHNTKTHKKINIENDIKEALEDPTTDFWTLEYRIKQPDGEPKTVIDKGIIIRNSLGKAIRMVGAITDITYRKNFEEQLVQLNKELQKQVQALKHANEELEQFAFITSHDLQEPLRMISSFMDQLQRKYKDQLDDKAHQYIHFATDGAKRMKKIILDLLEYSRAGKAFQDVEPVSLTEVLENYCYLRKKIMDEKGARIHYKDLPIVEAHKTSITQVLHNLLDNAIKYSKEGTTPEIHLKVTEQNNEWVCSITDNGIGIEQEFFDKIFVIFQRLHNREHYDGTGIGLALVKKQVESWGGKIWLESTANQGSTFYFTLKK